MAISEKKENMNENLLLALALALALAAVATNEWKSLKNSEKMEFN